MFTRNHSHKSALMGTSILFGAASMLLTAGAAFAQASDQGIETVTVTGYRASLQDSTNFKRASIGFNDSVFAEDIGKFPDSNVAEALNRVPGINIKREADNEGLQVAIRGLGANFTKILLNGEPIAIASTGATDQNTNNREVDLNMFPTELFTQLTVSKSPTADQLEGGLAGVVGMRSMRPFDNPGMHFTYNLQGTDYSQGATFGQRGTLIFSDTEGPFGVLIGASLVHNRMYTTGWEDGNAYWQNMGLSSTACGTGSCDTEGSNAWTIPGSIMGAYTGTAAQMSTTVPAWNIPIPGQPAGTYYPVGTVINQAWLQTNNPGLTTTQLSNVMVPRLGREMFELGTRDRANAVASFEYRPTDDLHFYLDRIVGRIVNNFNRSDMDAGFRSGTGTTLMIPTGVTADSNGVMTGGTFYNANFFLEYRPYVEHEDFFSINPGMDWQVTDLLHVNAQAYATRSHFFRDQSDFLAVTPPSQGYVGGTSGPAAPAGGAWLTWDNVGTSYPLVTTNLNLNNPDIFGWVTSEPSTSSPIGAGRLDLALEKRYTYTDGYHLDVTYGGDEFNIKVGGAYDDVYRQILAVAAGQLWQNAVCGDGPSINIPGQSNYLGCYGLNTSNPAAALAGDPGVTIPTYPGYGTYYTSGMTGTLKWNGSLVPESMVPQMLEPGPRGWVTGNKAEFYKLTNYAYWDQYAKTGFQTQLIDGRQEYTYPFSTSTVAGGGNTGEFEEKDWGYYAEVNGQFDISGHSLKYNAGFRWVETYEYIYSPVPDVTLTQTNGTISDGGKYPSAYYMGLDKSTWQAFLPSGSVVYSITDDLLLRFSASRTLGRANPNLMVSTANFNDVFAQNATLGNPNLKPYYSNNFDIGGEYYTGGEGYIGLTAFYKTISGWPASSQFTSTFSYLAQYAITYDTLSGTQKSNLLLNDSCNSDLTCANVPITVHTNLNLPGYLHIEGLELDYVQPFDFFLEQYGLKGFGFNGNLTTIGQYSSGAAPVHAGGVPGLEYNATGYYDNDGAMVRVSYTFTGKDHAANPGGQAALCFPNSSFSSLAIGCQGPWYYDASHGEVDLSSSLKLSKLVGDLPTDPEVTFDITNLNRSKIRNYDQYWNAPHYYYDPGSLFVLGFRGTF